MREVVARIGTRRGLHGRPAALFAARASRPDAAGVQLARADGDRPEWRDATRVTEVLALDLHRGDRVRLRLDRPGGGRVLAELAALLERDLDTE